jgi:hypothetical protein
MKKHCHRVEVASGAPPLLHAGVRVQVACGQGGSYGRFVWLDDAATFEVYDSAASHAPGRASFDGRSCGTRPAYMGTWHKTDAPSKSLGRLICIPGRRYNRIEWSDNRNHVYSAVRSRAPMRRLYGWWRRHEVSPYL